MMTEVKIQEACILPIMSSSSVAMEKIQVEPRTIPSSWSLFNLSTYSTFILTFHFPYKDYQLLHSILKLTQVLIKNFILKYPMNNWKRYLIVILYTNQNKRNINRLSWLLNTFFDSSYCSVCKHHTGPILH